MDPLQIINKYYPSASLAHNILVEHSKKVAGKALEIAHSLHAERPDIEFIVSAAMLHDIGIFMTAEPEISCFGDKRYICHGYLGRELLEKEGLPRHALVCERHVGVGISVADIDMHKLPVPRREMMPLTIEEKIICYADKFFSKKPDNVQREKPLEEVRRGIERYGPDKLKRFDELHALFYR